MRTLLAGLFLFVVSFSQVYAFEEKALKNLKFLRKCAKCDLSGVDLHGQSLKQVDINKANLSGANLEGANLKDATCARPISAARS
jgi:uncharacterized protein YjbI with pentapeptide repeats|tara:strand:+ start:704 stop:958 length:255 start_codon:yes stop_codon:yes gene_type:complete